MIGLLIVTRRVPIVEQELLTLSEYLSLPSAVCGLRVAPFLIFCVLFCCSLLIFLSFFYISIVSYPEMTLHLLICISKMAATQLSAFLYYLYRR